MGETKIRILAKILISDTTVTANCKHHLTPSQIDIKLHTKGLSKSVSSTQYIISAFNFKKLEGKLRGKKTQKTKPDSLKRESKYQNQTQTWQRFWN